MSEIHCDVVVVGAGPTGLTAAGDLARSGRSVTVLERWPSMNPSSRAFAVMPRTMELLAARGLAEDVLSTANRATGVALFAGAEIDLQHLDTRYPFITVTPQTNVDGALERYALASGADIRRGLEVVGLNQDSSGITVTASPRGIHDPTHTVTWRADYLVAADGAHSTVRRLIGAEFPGRTVLSSIVLADVKLAHGPSGGGLQLGSTSEAFGFLAPYGRADADGEWYRAMVWDRSDQRADDQPAAGGEVKRILGVSMGRDLGVREIGWMSRFHCDERQVARYRHGRVFLAGDAAHVHSPMGGQGMNTGIQDAVNLAWKIDAVLSGADDAVLDTYHDERHPIGRRVLRQSGLMARAVALHSKPARILRNYLAPQLLSISAVRDGIAGSFAGTGLRYRSQPGESKLVGSRAEPIPLAGHPLATVQRTPGFVFVRERDAAPITRSTLRQTRRCDDGPAVLIRPDGYIAWAGASLDVESWDGALRWWTGQRSASSSSSFA